MSEQWEEENNSVENEPRRRRKSIKIVVVAILAILLCILLALPYGLTAMRTNQGLSQNKTDALTTGAEGDNAQEQESDATGTENILVIGSDDRHGESTNVQGARSDAMVLLTLNHDSSTVTGVSIPRDLMIHNAPTCQTWDSTTRETTDGTWTPGEWVQSNEAFSAGGPACAVSTTEHLTGQGINRYLEIDFQGFEDTVDALGGITVNVCSPMRDTNEGIGDLFTETGEQLIDGEKTLDVARARHIVGDEGSDTSRMDRQQYLMERILEEVTSPETMLDSDRFSRLADAFVENTINDNISLSFLTSTATSMRNGEATFYTLPVAPWDQDPNRLIDDEDTTHWLFQSLNDGKLVTENQAQERFQGTPRTPESTAQGISTQRISTQQTQDDSNESSLPCL